MQGHLGSVWSRVHKWSVCKSTAKGNFGGTSGPAIIVVTKENCCNYCWSSDSKNIIARIAPGNMQGPLKMLSHHLLTDFFQSCSLLKYNFWNMAEFQLAFSHYWSWLQISTLMHPVHHNTQSPWPVTIQHCNACHSTQRWFWWSYSKLWNVEIIRQSINPVVSNLPCSSRLLLVLSRLSSGHLCYICTHVATCVTFWCKSGFERKWYSLLIITTYYLMCTLSICISSMLTLFGILRTSKVVTFSCQNVVTFRCQWIFIFEQMAMSIGLSYLVSHWQNIRIS